MVALVFEVCPPHEEVFHCNLWHYHLWDIVAIIWLFQRKISFTLILFSVIIVQGMSSVFIINFSVFPGISRKMFIISLLSLALCIHKYALKETGIFINFLFRLNHWFFQRLVVLTDHTIFIKGSLWSKFINRVCFNCFLRLMFQSTNSYWRAILKMA